MHQHLHQHLHGRNYPGYLLFSALRLSVNRSNLSRRRKGEGEKDISLSQHFISANTKHACESYF